MSKRILIITGDGGESYETLFAVHRFQEAGYEARIAAPSKRRLNLVMHDFEPGWDTYKESPGYVLESDLTFDEVTVRDYEAVVCIGGRAPEYLRNDRARAGDPAGVRRAREVDLRDLPRRPARRRGRAAQGQARDLLRARPQRSRGVRRHYVASPAVRDGRLVSSPTWREHPAFYREVFACLQQPVVA